MRSATSPVLSLLLFLLLPSSTLATSLSQFQSIANFPAACETAYNAQISGCTDADFSNGAPCSATCISGLQALTTTIDRGCAGSQADPNTLIGMFFVGKGVTALCPNYAAPVASAPATSVPAASPSSAKPAGTTSTSSAVVIKTSTIGASSLSTTSSAPPPPPTTTTAPSSTAAQSSTTSAPPAPVSTSTTTATTTATLVSSTNSPTFDKTAINDGSKTVVTSKADQTASSNADAFGGGGSPFEISAGVKGVEGVSKVALLAVVAGLLLAL